MFAAFLDLSAELLHLLQVLVYFLDLMVLATMPCLQFTPDHLKGCL